METELMKVEVRSVIVLVLFSAIFCGGLRCVGKRPMMGQLFNLVIIKLP